MIADNVRDLRALLREAACALSAPLAQYDHSLSARLWAAHDALHYPVVQAGSDLKDASTPPFDTKTACFCDKTRANHPAIPDGSRDDRRDHDRHQPRPL